MKSHGHEVMIAFIVAAGILGVITVIGHFIDRNTLHETEKMKTCVAAGKSWIYDDDKNLFECREEAKS